MNTPNPSPNSPSIEKEDFVQLPDVLQIDSIHQDDAEYIKKHFCEHKKQIQDSLEKFYRYTADLSTQQFIDYKREVSFVKSLLTALKTLNDPKGSDRKRITDEIIKYHAQVQEILNFEQSPDFQRFQDTMQDLMQYGKKLNSAITKFQTEEWESVLEALKRMDDIKNELHSMISSNGYRKSEYNTIIKNAPKDIRETTQECSPKQKTSVFNKFLVFLGK